MNDLASPSAFGVLTAPDTFVIQRLLPGPIDRVWSYIVDSELRAKWMATGKLDLTVGSLAELVWRNDELTNPPGQRPQGFSAEHRMQTRVNEVDPPRQLSISWGGRGDVSFELAPSGEQVLLTVVHRRLPDRASLLLVGPG
ncbi:MAG: SRPBCC domain-containing protein, partial [Hyphomicrobiales bacterium]|nr:SRPBCC domain-containing protein [Hyphomicrobiales bacterium]